MGKIVNQTQLAEFLGTSDVTLWQWQKEGLPIKTRNLRGLSNEYDTADVVKWLVARAEKKASGGETQEQRLKRVQADKIEMEIAQLRQELVPAADIEARWAAMIMAARNRLLSMPGQLAELLEIAQGASAKRDVLIEEFDKVLQELSVNDESDRILEEYVARIFEGMAREPASPGDDQDAGEVGSAQAPDSGGVGRGETVPEREELRHAGSLPSGGGAVHQGAARVSDPA